MKNLLKDQLFSDIVFKLNYMKKSKMDFQQLQAMF